jgi:hypothetical protein
MTCSESWQACIDVGDAGSDLWGGQWQSDGSGQQHVFTIEIVRSCETGTASATPIATATVEIQASARVTSTGRIRPLPPGEVNAHDERFLAHECAVAQTIVCRVTRLTAAVR